MKVKWGGGGGWNTCPNSGYQNTAPGQNLPREPRPWKVWFAWHPVPLRALGIKRYPVDAVSDMVRTEWVWLRNVARRRMQPLHHGDWEYAPAHKALTQ